MLIAVTGASGLIGSALLPVLESEGHTVRKFVRRQNETAPETVFWIPEQHRIEAAKLDGFDAVIHLAGEPIAQRWRRNVKQKIWQSRVEGTRFLCEFLAKQNRPPAALICASAIGFYGCGKTGLEHEAKLLTEAGDSGSGFLADVVRDWEQAVAPLEDSQTRIIHLRLGLVLSPEGGALEKMLSPFKLGLGGVLGTGQQWMSWISLRDVVGVIQHILKHDNLQGVFNTVSPNPVSNAEFTALLGWILHRPTLLPLPEVLLKLFFGEMAKETLLADQRVYPERLLTSGFQFQDTDLENALRQMFGKLSAA